MRARGRVVASRAAVELGRILESLQVVGHRDHRKKNHYEHRQRGDLRPHADTLVGRMPQPQLNEHGGQQRPDEIECQLHLYP